MRTVSVTGATGFIGLHLVRRLLARDDLAVRALVHDAADEVLPRSPRLHRVRGDLADPDTLKALVGPGWDLVNLAYPPPWPPDRHVAAAVALSAAAVDAGVRRVVHCSTAVVVGAARAGCVTESTVPHPVSVYERTKLAVEKAWLDGCRGRAEIAVLRPTAVYGPHGRNLLKLARDLTSGSRLVNYLRSSLYQARRMNLVNVDNVVAAIEFVLEAPVPARGEVYIVSDDEDPANNFRDVERLLMQSLRIPGYALPPLPVPGVFLSALLRVAGRSNIDPDRVYDGSKLERAGLRKPCALEPGLRAFASWYASESAARAPR
jgi:nucleoside-diphosphate-sugar epimerase